MLVLTLKNKIFYQYLITRKRESRSSFGCRQKKVSNRFKYISAILIIIVKKYLRILGVINSGSFGPRYLSLAWSSLLVTAMCALLQRSDIFWSKNLARNALPLRMSIVEIGKSPLGSLGSSVQRQLNRCPIHYACAFLWLLMAFLRFNVVKKMPLRITNGPSKTQIFLAEFC